MGGVHVVSMPIDYSENTRVLIEELNNHVPSGERRSKSPLKNPRG